MWYKFSHDLLRVLPVFFASFYLALNLPAYGAKEGFFPETSLGHAHSNLFQLTDALAIQMTKERQVREIFIDRDNLRDIDSGEVLNFSGYLLHELESSLSRHGFYLVYQPQDAALLLGAAYKRNGDGVRVFFQCHKKAKSVKQSWAYELSHINIPRDAFQHTLEGKAMKLIQDLTSVSGRKRVYVKPIREGQQGFVSDFSRSFTARLKTQMFRYWRRTEVIDERPVLSNFFENNGIRTKAKDVEDLNSLEAIYAEADSVLEGSYFIEGKHVTVFLDLKDVKGKLVCSSQTEIPRALILSRLDNPQAAVLTDLGDTSGKRHRSVVRILTNLGGDFPVYMEGEKISFLVQVQEPLFVYVYTIDSTGAVTRLYPPEMISSERRFQPGNIYKLPDDNHPFQYDIRAPFGMDLVKIFASSVRIPTPKISSAFFSKSYDGMRARKIGLKRLEAQQVLASQRVINPMDLVDYYRGTASSMSVILYEDQVMVETRQKTSEP